MLHFLFSFKGRVSRADVWKFVVAVWGLNFVAFFASLEFADGAPMLLPQFVLMLGWGLPSRPSNPPRLFNAPQSLQVLLRTSF